MYSGWVGDDDPTFGGLESALKSYLQSAWASKWQFFHEILPETALKISLFTGTPVSSRKTTATKF